MLEEARSVLRGDRSLSDNLVFKLSDDLLLDLAGRYGTPYFLMDEGTLRRNARVMAYAYSKYVGGASIAYSVKANFLPRVLRVFSDEGLMFDTATAEELYFVDRATGKASNSLYTSVTQTYREFSKAIEYGVRMFVVGSSMGLQNLMAAAQDAGTEVGVLVRINPEVSYGPASDHFYKSGKYGVPVYDHGGESAIGLAKAASEGSHVYMKGFHFHVGTQIEDPQKFVRALDKVEELITVLREEDIGQNPEVIDVGGGMPVSYDGEDIDMGDIAGRVVGRLNELADFIGEPPRLIVESGRFLVAEAGVLASAVVGTKMYYNTKYAFLDTGYHNLLDAALVKQVYPMRVVPSGGDLAPGDVVLAGMLCDMDDVFPIGRNARLADLDVGKLVAFGNAGAYSVVFNMPFHSQPKPPVLFRTSGGDVEVARPRQGLDALYSEEGGLGLS